MGYFIWVYGYVRGLNYLVIILMVCNFLGYVEVFIELFIFFSFLEDLVGFCFNVVVFIDLEEVLVY